MRALVLCYEYPPIGGGGGRVAAQVAAALAERGHQISVITAGMPHLPRSINIDGVKVIRVAAFRRREDTSTVLEMLLWIVAAFPVALWKTWRWRPEVIHAHFAVPTGVVAWLVSKFTRVPYVLTAHLGDVPGGVPEQTDRLFKKIKFLTVPIWQSAVRVTAVSSFVADLAEKAYRLRPDIIHNGIKLPKEVLKKRNKIPQLLFVGRLSLQKNPLLVVQALALLREWEWNLKIIGDGPLATRLREEVTKFQLQDRISFLGWLSSEEVKSVMEQSDLLLMPSLAEGLPMAAVEGLAYGLAIVGSDIGGLQDVLIEGKNGVAFNLISGANGLSKALSHFFDNRKLLEAAQEQSRELATSFEWKRSIDLYEKILQEQ